jgi:REP element-mobilizing transposase RayT
MSRPLRLEFAGALYHITSRGNEKKAVYLEDADFELFLSLMAEVCQRFNWFIHAYCLMTNHYHLVVETPDGNLSRGMRHLNGVYTQRFNSKHKRVGHLFQGRYKAILVDKDSYLLELSRYVVLNPVRARMVNEPGDWQWSSYRVMIGKQDSFEGLATDALLLQFGNQRNPAIECFQTFISQGKGQAIWRYLNHQIYLGDKDFVEKQRVHLAKQEGKLSEVPLKQRRKPAKTLEEYREENTNRNDAIFAAYQSGGYTMDEIAEYFGCHYSTVSRAIAKCKT